eukprot:COSAG01_NODE_6935_length_3432_cov_3.466247_3_plen_266_part_00
MRMPDTNLFVRRQLCRYLLQFCRRMLLRPGRGLRRSRLCALQLIFGRMLARFGCSQLGAQLRSPSPLGTQQRALRLGKHLWPQPYAHSCLSAWPRRARSPMALATEYACLQAARACAPRPTCSASSGAVVPPPVAPRFCAWAATSARVDASSSSTRCSCALSCSAVACSALRSCSTDAIRCVASRAWVCSLASAASSRLISASSSCNRAPSTRDVVRPASSTRQTAVAITRESQAPLTGQLGPMRYVHSERLGRWLCWRRLRLLG